jgi:hypothetical protein
MKLLIALYLFAFGVEQREYQSQEYPPMTVIIKSPAAENRDTYFSQGTTYSFEVFKGNGEIEHIVKSFKADPKVASVNTGKVTGDYFSITLSLKSKADRQWFGKAFSNAGLTHVKINNQPVVASKSL